VLDAKWEGDHRFQLEMVPQDGHLSAKLLWRKQMG